MTTPLARTPGTRPGAMTGAMRAAGPEAPGPKVLRVALVRDGAILEERVSRNEPVFVGTHESNTLVVTGEGAPRRHELFRPEAGSYTLRVTEELRGRVSVDGQATALDTLRSFSLGQSGRGALVLGRFRVLFQLVDAPPPPVRPRLPAATRGAFRADIDWLFTAFVVFSYVSFAAFLVYLEGRDWEIETGIARVPDFIVRPVFGEPEPPPPDAPEETEGELEAPTEPTAPRAEWADQSEGTSSRRPSAEVSARLAEDVAATAEALIIGALGVSGGALADVLAGGASTPDAQALLEQVAGVDVAHRGPSALRPRASQRGSGVGVNPLAPSVPSMAVVTSAVRETEVRGSIRVPGGGDVGGSGDFDPAIVSRTIRARLRAIQRCYEIQLGRNPTLAGTVRVRFTVTERGTVSGARALENSTNDPALAACVVQRLGRLRFHPGPEGGSVDFAYPFVFAPQR